MDANSAAIRGMGLFYVGLAEMEQIDSDAWFAGNTDQEWIRPAIEQFERAQQDFRTAREECSAFQEWFPEERREEITPDIEYFGRMEERLGEVIQQLNKRELPTLSLVHSLCSSMNEAQTVGARKAVALRGTRGHFPAGHP
jgi:hypothetical protein